MKNLILLLSLISILFACDYPKEKPTPDPIEPDIEYPNPNIIKEIDKRFTYTEQIISTEATVLSVEQELIMPSDYLTEVMTVVTREQDTLLFPDAEAYKHLVNQNIAIQYKLSEGNSLLVCFDCDSYSQKIGLYDITTFPSEVKFESFKLKKYIPDEYLIAASMFLMQKEDGQTEEFRCLDMEMIVDSLKMATAYHQYGVITPLSPQLLSIKEY